MPTEQQILTLIRKIVPGSKRFLFDDTAIIENNFVVTTDTLIENTHFTQTTYTPEEIGWKALAVNLSDIAAMGAIPLYALVSLSIPKSFIKAGLKPASSLSWIKKLYKGINACGKKYKTQIIGGNLARSRETNITITVIGKTIAKNIGKRSNAKPGDVVFVTGNFGDSACGYLLLKQKTSVISSQLLTLIKKHKTPTPQINLGQKIVQVTQRAALMDSSDGLSDCLIQIAKESNVKVLAEESKLPISLSTRKAAKILRKDPVKLALYGGEDYQLVGTVSKNEWEKLRKTKEFKIIGEVVKGNSAFLKQKNGKLVKLDMNKAFRHFF